MLFQAHNLNVAHQLLLLLWRGNTADQNLLQFNGSLCAVAGTPSHSGAVALTARHRVLAEWAAVCLLSDDAPWSQGPSFVFADKIVTNAIWSWCTPVVCSFEWNLDDSSLTYGILFQFQCRFGYKASVCITVIGHYSLRIGCLLSTCISTISFSPQIACGSEHNLAIVGECTLTRTYILLKLLLLLLKRWLKSLSICHILDTTSLKKIRWGKDFKRNEAEIVWAESVQEAETGDFALWPDMSQALMTWRSRQCT